MLISWCKEAQPLCTLREGSEAFYRADETTRWGKMEYRAGGEGRRRRGLDGPGGQRGRAGALRTLRPLLAASVRHGHEALGRRTAGRGIGPGCLHERLAQRGVLRPCPRELRDVAVPRRPQPGDGPGSEAAVQAQAGRRAWALC